MTKPAVASFSTLTPELDRSHLKLIGEEAVPSAPDQSAKSVSVATARETEADVDDLWDNVPI